MSVLPALTRSYATRANVPHPDTSTQVRLRQGNFWMNYAAMLDTLTGGTLVGTRHANSIWTLDSSCDGTTAGSPGDGIDRLNKTTFTPANWVLNSSGSAHSWAVLFNSSYSMYCLIDCNGNNNAYGRIAFSSSAFSGGTTTNGPTAASEFDMGTASVGVSQQCPLWNDDVAGNFNYGHFVTTNTGEYMFLCSRSGLGCGFSTAFGLWGTTGAQTGDTRNKFAFYTTQVSSRGAGTVGTLSSNASIIGRLPNNSAPVSSGGIGVPSFGGTAYMGAQGVDALTGNYLVYDMVVMSLNVGQISRRGLLTDLYWVGTAPLLGSVPSAAAQERVIMGDVIIPFTGTPPIG